VQAEEAQDEHHDHDETYQVDDTVHVSAASANNPSTDCARSDYFLITSNFPAPLLVPPQSRRIVNKPSPHGKSKLRR
jgi:hypothetical protein